MAEMILLQRSQVNFIFWLEVFPIYVLEQVEMLFCSKSEKCEMCNFLALVSTQFLRHFIGQKSLFLLEHKHTEHCIN